MGSENSSKRAAIEARIPHRDPFLLLDEIVEEGDGWIQTRWTAQPTLEAFRGHYPGQPVLPGVLISEMCFQSAAVMLSDPDAPSGAPGQPVPVLTKIEEARFKRMVRPGETLEARVDLVERLKNARYMKAVVKVGGKLCLRISFVVAEAPAESLPGAAASGASAS